MYRSEFTFEDSGIADASDNARIFVDQIKTNGVLKKAYETWMKQEPPANFPDVVEGVPFAAS